MPLEDTWEYQQDLKSRSLRDRIYQGLFGSDIKIRRNNGGDLVLDREYAIDCEITFPQGGRITLQEKVLSYRWAFCDTFTMEYHQNASTKEPGEFFKIASQFYFSSYLNEAGDGFMNWHIIDLGPFMVWLRLHLDSYSPTKTGGSQADFIAIPYKDIPKELIFASG